MASAVCVACRHQIDGAAKLCPYCGADPQTGQKVDTQTMVQEVFQSKQLTTTEGVLQFARQRQGIVVVSAILIGLVLLSALYQFAMRRNQRAVNDSAAVPITEVTDLMSQPNETRQLPMPPLQFQFDGRPQTMRTFIVEPGAVAPAQPPQQAPPQQPPQPQ